MCGWWLVDCEVRVGVGVKARGGIGGRGEEVEERKGGKGGREVEGGEGGRIKG